MSGPECPQGLGDGGGSEGCLVENGGGAQQGQDARGVRRHAHGRHLNINN